jgi:hypothetical protein
VGVLTNNELVEGSGHHLRVGTVLTFAWKDWGKPQKTLVGIAQAKILIWSLPHTKHTTQLHLISLLSSGI